VRQEPSLISPSDGFFALGGSRPRDIYQSAFPGLREGSQRGLAGFCALDNAVCDPLTNVVLFSERVLFANSFQCDIHIGKRPGVEAAFHRCNRLNLVNVTLGNHG
jgi:hypothetical protein